MEFMNSFYRWILLGIPSRYFLIQLAISATSCLLMLFQGAHWGYEAIILIVINSLLYPYSIYFYHSATNNDRSFFKKLFALWLCWSFAFIFGPIGIIVQFTKFKRVPNAKEF
ncbi:hypothetical protein [Marinomonas sp.]|uniref:hypothetical protein n=1 Tax=Marinomonas sp. TaxID=1904862 RepID=UPI003BAA0F79